MVGVNGEVNHADGINGQAAQRLFNLLNCLLLSEKRPLTVSMLEAAYLEVLKYSEYLLC